MQRHSSIAEVQEKACFSLGELAEDYGSRRLIASRGGIESVLSSMRRHVSEAAVQSAGCRALGRLAYLSADNCKVIAKENGVPLVISAMRRHLEHAHVQSSGCFVLSHLTEARDGCKTIVKNDGIGAVANAMQRHVAHEGVQKWACCLLKPLSNEALRYQRQIRDAGCTQLIQLVKVTFPENKSLHWYADDALKSLGDSVR